MNSLYEIAVFSHFCREMRLVLISRYFGTVFSVATVFLTSQNCLSTSQSRDTCCKLNCPKRVHAVYWFLAALAALYLTLVSQSVGEWVSDCHFRILTQRVTFET